jgi:hypothetical protein
VPLRLFSSAPAVGLDSSIDALALPDNPEQIQILSTEGQVIRSGRKGSLTQGDWPSLVSAQSALRKKRERAELQRMMAESSLTTDAELKRYRQELDAEIAQQQTIDPNQKHAQSSTKTRVRRKNRNT